MRCYKCGMGLSEKDYCTGCGADVRLYKKIIYTSNRLYNEGLERAKVRDLSGAAECLRECLKLNKHNTDARNLLGLIYYERGEVVEALSEWVVSRSFKPKKNLADDYVDAIQNNPAVIEQMNHTIKKFNLALEYCRQGGYDVAVIQLKKVLSTSPKYLKARQLLALLYIQNGEYEKARKELDAAAAIDTGNLITTRYYRELDALGVTAEKAEKTAKKEAHRYVQDNQTIIQPINSKERTIFATVLILLVGVGLGIALSYFWLFPSKTKDDNQKANEQIIAISEQLDGKTSKIAQLEKELDEQKSDNGLLREELARYDGTDTVLEELESLLRVADLYADPEVPVTEVAIAILKINEDRLILMDDASYLALYRNIYNNISEEAAEQFYDSGLAAYRAGRYADAERDLEYAVTYNPLDGYAWYNLGKSCRENGNDVRAIEAFEKVIELAPGSERAKQSKVYIKELQE